MAATFEWSESNTVGEVVHDNISNLNMGSNDSYEIVPATYPIVGGENAFEKYVRGKFTGTFTEITNMKFWKSGGTYKTAEVIKAEENVAYIQPTTSASTVATTNIPVDSSNALVIEESGGTTGTMTATGYTKYICVQLQTGGTTPAGDLNQKEFTFQYDEV